MNAGPHLVKTQITLASIVIALVMMAGIGADYFLGVHAIAISDHRWCSTLAVLTHPPVRRPARPDDPKMAVAERQYVLYLRFRELRREFGCDG